MLNVLYKYVQTLVFHLHSYSSTLVYYAFAVLAIVSNSNVMRSSNNVSCTLSHTHQVTDTDTTKYNNLKWNGIVFS